MVPTDSATASYLRLPRKVTTDRDGKSLSCTMCVQGCVLFVISVLPLNSCFLKVLSKFVEDDLNFKEGRM